MLNLVTIVLTLVRIFADTSKLLSSLIISRLDSQKQFHLMSCVAFNLVFPRPLSEVQRRRDQILSIHVFYMKVIHQKAVLNYLDS